MQRVIYDLLSSTFVYFCIIVSFLVPEMQLFLQYLHCRQLEKFAAVQGDEETTTNLISSVWTKLLAFVAVPRLLKPLGFKNAPVPPHAIYFDATNSLVTIVTLLDLLLTFGIVFRPLGAQAVAVYRCVS